MLHCRNAQSLQWLCRSARNSGVAAEATADANAPIRDVNPDDLVA
jgi:hypothetical protein